MYNIAIHLLRCILSHSIQINFFHKICFFFLTNLVFHENYHKQKTSINDKLFPHGKIQKTNNLYIDEFFFLVFLSDIYELCQKYDLHTTPSTLYKINSVFVWKLSKEKRVYIAMCQRITIFRLFAFIVQHSRWIFPLINFSRQTAKGCLLNSLFMFEKEAFCSC